VLLQPAVFNIVDNGNLFDTDETDAGLTLCGLNVPVSIPAEFITVLIHLSIFADKFIGRNKTDK
jgi:hypothetical protein